MPITDKPMKTYAHMQSPASSTVREHVRSLDTVRFPPRYHAYARLYRSKLSCKSRKITINPCTALNADLRTHVSSMLSMKTRYPLSNLARARTVRTVDCVCAKSWAGMNGHIT